MRANHHTHSEFCDGRISAAEMAEAAYSAGFSVLGFSSHAPLPFETEWTMDPDRLADYVRTIRALGEVYHGRMEILLGLEVDYIAGICGPSDGRFDAIGLDYVIGAVHHVRPPRLGHDALATVDDGQDSFDALIAQGYDNNTDALVADYYKAATECIKAGGFDIFGHFDLIRKNNPNMSRFHEDTSHYMAAAMMAVDALAGTDIIVEINTGGMARGKLTTPYPAAWILRELRLRNVDICLNSDAHNAAHLVACRDAGLQAAAAAGYDRLTIITAKGRERVPLA
ncbi:MAG: histidinol-phosphatase [Clostridia bacterium]|jgi:histidinol-phosphatase (PHP family)|nr:histidinol-phosphatase [Spirochaetia bacterium]